MKKNNVPIPDSKEQVDAFINSQENLSLLKFITCGSVDDGKSTLIGRILFTATITFFIPTSDVKKECLFVCSKTPFLASIKITATSAVEAPVTIFLVYCS